MKEGFSPDNFIKKAAQKETMSTITLETIHEDIVGLKQEVQSLKDCVHEDFLELSESTKRDIEESHTQIASGKFVSLEEV